MEKYRNIMAELPPAGVFGESDTPHGFVKHTYYSRTAERETGVNVLLPPDYTEDRAYPVLYFLHGYYDSEDWLLRDIPELNSMLACMYKSKDAEEMIVVCPYIFCSREKERCTEMTLENSLCYDNFINDLTTDLMPFVESSFSVSRGRENTAITGFSMGGRESLFIGFRRPDLFGYIGAAAPAPGLVPVENSAAHPGQLCEGEMTFADNSPKLLLITASDSDGVVGLFPKSYHHTLTLNKTEHLWHELKGTGHDASTVRPHLYNFCRMIFR